MFINRFISSFLFFFVFLFFFSIASVAFAFEDDGYWQNGYYWKLLSTSGPTPSSVCKPPNYITNKTTKNFQCNLVPSGNSYYATRYVCNSSSPSSAKCGIEPDPPEPQSCQDLKDNYPDGFTTSYSGYSLQICERGCLATTSGVQVQDVDNPNVWHSTIIYSGEECNSGFNADSGAEQVKDQYQHDEELQNCYDSSGRLIGQISLGLSCPSLDICYDVSTGAAIGTTSQSTSCESGVKRNELTVDPNDTSVSSSKTQVEHADGSITETIETVTTESGLDGSIETTVETTTREIDANGNVVSEETEIKKDTNKTTISCDTRPDLPECKIKNDNPTASVPDNCLTPPVCTGDPVGCASVEIQWRELCNTDSMNEQEFEEWKQSSEVLNKYGVDVDENGVLAALDRGEIDVGDSLNLDDLGDNGSTGSCPADYELGILGSVISFKYDSICDFAESVRPLVIFASIFLCMLMVSRSLVGT